MKNVDELYKKYHNAYKSKLNDAKQKTFGYKQFKFVDRADEELKLDEETKELMLAALLKWLSSKNDFNEPVKLVKDVRDDTSNVKPGSGDKKLFDDLENLINDISNNKVKKNIMKTMKKSIAE